MGWAHELTFPTHLERRRISSSGADSLDTRQSPFQWELGSNTQKGLQGAGRGTASGAGTGAAGQPQGGHLPNRIADRKGSDRHKWFSN